MNALRYAVSQMFIFGQQIIASDSLNSMLTISTEELSAIDFMWQLFSVFGIGMILIHYLLDLNNTIANSGSNFTMQLFTMPTIKFCMACVIVSAGGDITCRLVEFGNTIINTASDTMASAGDGFDLLTDNMAENWGIFALLLGMLIGLVYWLVCLIIHFLFMYKALSYKIELIFRVGLAPLFMGDLADGFHSGAMRYWKRILGVMIYGASFIIVIIIGNEIIQASGGADGFHFLGALGEDSDENFLGNILAGLDGGLCAILVAVAELGVLGSIKQVCMEIGQ